ncbi:SulP family inorganic anion transporter [Allobacillus sp. GCM10007491]|uniref:SulP family inorganic anion transporter n=1 Tax=Allobacillus saliphilus TaxID=2912308 RepID=A0A941HV38_9BACI|nr:SulP family inorganic anion transporter [Allobacillus saliphilus]MBR7555024.1 SulP family inorganic anion transporter [Allobacillus saliphilus]
MNRFYENTIKNYSFSDLKKDLISGLTVGMIAIPLAMAFATASGVRPEYGLYTAIIAGILISLFGGSKFQIGGPTGAFVPVLLGIVTIYGYENLLIAGLLAGFMLLFMGLFKLGSLIKFMPRPVTVGFTAGIAVIIFTGQIANFLGITSIEQHSRFILNIREIWNHLHLTQLSSIFIASLCMAIILLTPKLFPKIPGAIVGLIVSTIIATIFFTDQVPTIGSVFGSIPSSLPEFQFPELTWERIQPMLVPALTIAALGGIESLLSAVVADGMAGSKHDSNRELIGQGIANIVTPLFGGIAATGAIARTATNIKTGAVTRMSGVFHGVFVLLTLLLFAPYASLIPLASMAPVLMIVAWNMSDRRHFAHLLKMRTGDSLILVATFLLTVFTTITIAVMTGLVLALIMFARRMSNLLVVSKVLPDHSQTNETVEAYMVDATRNCPQIEIYTIEGPLFFGAAQVFEQRVMDSIHYRPKALLLRMSKVPFMDTTGIANLSNVVSHFNKQGGTIILSGISPKLREILKSSNLYDDIGEENIFEHTGQALDHAISIIDHPKCIGCKQFAFHECHQLSAGKPLVTD